MVAIAFIHPDLGIGGAERFIVDTAVALKSKGHKIWIFTSHHDPSHCFHETIDGTLDVTSVGDWLPRHVFGRLHALFAYIRMIYVALYLVFVSRYAPDVIFCDQVSACIPILRLLYTPSNEHFGLVPIEAMYMKCPVIACNSGGPLETVVNNVTGFHCDPNPLAFSTAMKKIYEKDTAQTYGNAGYKHVMENFSFQSFSEKLDKSIKMLFYTTKNMKRMEAPSTKIPICCLCVALGAVITYCVSMALLIYTT